MTKRPKLVEKRKAAGYSQEALGEHCGVDRKTVARWEAGETSPYPENILTLCDTLGVKDPREINIYEEEQEDSMELTRRQAIIDFLLASGIPFVVGSDGSPVLASPVIVPEEFLGQCSAALRGCWPLLDSGRFDIVESALSASVPTLSRLAYTPSKYQSLAARLAMQAKMLQAILATHYRTDYAGREIAAMEAMRFAEIGGDPRMCVAAMIDYGMSYVNRPDPMPNKAIAIFLEAEGLVDDSEAPLMQCDLYGCLSNAYAQSGNEMDALKALGHAENILSNRASSTQDLDWLYGQGFPEYNPLKGRVYLRLASHFPEGGYFQKAYDAFALSSSQTASRNSAGAIVFQADAARGLGDPEHFAELLERGMRLAIEIGSKRRQSEAFTVLRSIPESWQREPRILALQRNLPALAVI